MLQPQNIPDYFISLLNHGDVAVDATAGNGYDTLKLCRAVGKSGKVYAFDIQKSAIENTKMRVNEYTNVKFICDSHSNMDLYISEPVRGVIFNLGYLPGSDHNVQTKPCTTIQAIEKALNIISDDGFVSIMVYYGKNSGTDEKEAVMTFLKNLNHKKYTVLTMDFHNRPNNPPLNVVITKNNIL